MTKPSIEEANLLKRMRALPTGAHSFTVIKHKGKLVHLVMTESEKLEPLGKPDLQKKKT